MNKKISHFFLAAIMAFAFLMPMFAQSTSAQVSPDPAPHKVILINQFNHRAALFSDLALRAQDIVGVDRMLFLISGQLGIPVTVMESEFRGFGVPFDKFLMSELFARAAGVPSAFVFDLVNSNRSFGQIALQLNLPFKFTNIFLTGFINLMIDEINISRGQIVSTPETAIAELTGALEQFRARMFLFQNVLGPVAFNKLFIRTLANVTGMDINVLVIMRGQFSDDVSADQFAAFVLLDNVVSSATMVAIQFNGMAVVTPGGIYGRLSQSQIPASLFINRMLIFTRALNIDASQA